MRSDKKIQGGTNNSPNVNRSPTNSPKPLRANQNIRFYADLLNSYFQEYIQYLQTLGFMLIDIKSNSTRRSKSYIEKTSEENVRRRHGTGKVNKTENRIMYLQKSLLGGILIFEIFISEPFFTPNFMLWKPQGTTKDDTECNREKLCIHIS